METAGEWLILLRRPTPPGASPSTARVRSNTHVHTPDSLGGQRSNDLTRLFLLLVWNNDNDMRIVDAVYDEYAVIHTIKTKNDVSQVLNKLYSKSYFNWEFKALAKTCVIKKLLWTW